VVSGTANLLSDCDVQTVAGDGKPYLLHRDGDARSDQGNRLEHPRRPQRTSAPEEVAMSNGNFGLPAHPDLEYYRKQAKHLLRSYETGDAAARARAADVLGDRAAGRFLLSDAQFVLAQEHGFRTWAEFRADIQSLSATGGRPVSRLWGTAGTFASHADALLTELRRGDPGALQRLRAYVPRYAAAADASTAELRDARLIDGFPP
jgi:hypothetical protein